MKSAELNSSGEHYAVSLTTTGRRVTATLDPRNHTFEAFLNDDLSPFFAQSLITRAERALAGQEGTYTTDSFGIDFTGVGVVLEHTYLDDQSPVLVESRNFIEIILAVSRAQIEVASDD